MKSSSFNLNDVKRSGSIDQKNGRRKDQSKLGRKKKKNIKEVGGNDGRKKRVKEIRIKSRGRFKREKSLYPKVVNQ